MTDTADKIGAPVAAHPSMRRDRRGALRASAIAVLYVLFAAVATLVNVALQEAVIWLIPFAALSWSIGAGTAGGFLVKYWLDKRWIFFDVSSSRRNEAAKIVVYGLFSVSTTLIFWLAELAAWWTFATPTAKYAGAVIGLSIGYSIKYRLDKSFVFARSRP